MLLVIALLSGCCYGTYTAEQDEVLRRDLMNGYSANSRPAESVHVHVEFSLFSINGLDTKASTFSTSAYFDLWWHDNRLSWKPESYGDIKRIFFIGDSIWRPSMSIVNEADSLDIVYDEKGLVRCEFDGTCYWDPPAVTTTSCDLDVTFYPCDRQTCSIDVITWQYNVHEVDLRPAEQGIHLTYFKEHVDWHVLGHEMITENAEKRGHEHAQLKVVFTIQRRPIHEVISVILPTVIMAFMSPFVFMLPADSGEKIGYIVTVFLAYAVLLTLVQSQLPTAAKSPSILSIYLAIITILAATCVMMTVVILNFHYADEEESPKGAINKIVIYMEKVMRRKSSAKKYTAVDGPDQDDANQEKVETMRQHTWKQIAAIMDMFCFRLIITVTALWTVALIVLLLVGWFIHPKWVD